jgi:hypothetical protein
MHALLLAKCERSEGAATPPRYRAGRQSTRGPPGRASERGRYVSQGPATTGVSCTTSDAIRDCPRTGSWFDRV